MKRFLTIFVLSLIILTGCSPQKRLARLVEKHPELVRKDTITIIDTVILIGSMADTVLLNTITRDTIIIKDRQLTIKYFNTGDSIYIKGKCDTIKLIREIPVEIHTVSPIKRVKYTPKFVKYSAWALWILLLMTGAFFTGRYFLRKYNIIGK